MIVITTFLLRMLLILVAIFDVSFCNINARTNVACLESERQALLRFKQDLVDDSNRLASWVDHDKEDGRDCCKWAGVVCNNSTGHVTELRLKDSYPYKSPLGGRVNPSLLNLKYLSHLDLSNNSFGGSQIPTFFGNLANLRHLDLGYSNLYSDNLQWLSSLTLLHHLDLSSVNLTLALDWFQVINNLPFLVELHLPACQLCQHIPPLSLVNNQSSLAILDLSCNHLDNSLILQWVSHLYHLTSVDLSKNNFHGPLPSGLRSLTHLRHINLMSNQFNSSMPDWLYSFDLESLNLCSNNMGGVISSSIGNLTSLMSLDLSDNDFKMDGRQTLDSIGHLCNLRKLHLSGVKIDADVADIFHSLSCASNGLETLYLSSTGLFGNLTNVHLGRFKDLVDLKLGNNSISGAIPLAFGELQSLKRVGLSKNLLEGVVSDIHFAKLTRLMEFEANGNKLLQLQVSPSWTPPFHLGVLKLESWKLGPKFPVWLQSQSSTLYQLDLSNTGISETIPQWFWNLALSNIKQLNLSNNHIMGEIPPMDATSQYRGILDLSSNFFTGQLPPFASYAVALDLSKNLFSGYLSHFICHQMNESKDMEVLNLGDNFLSGKLPDCWTAWKNLVALKLDNNNFSGSIPKSMKDLTLLQSLHLHNNSLTGEVPLSLRSCENLETIDLAENRLDGVIPKWIGKHMLKLMILNLRSNKFHGGIPEELCALTTLQVLDLSHNNLSGRIPQCINNLTAMITLNNSAAKQISYHAAENVFEEMILCMKGKMMKYGTTLNLVRVVDFSDNFLWGEIPEEVTRLVKLQSLNLSHNLFNGRIPQDIGAMRSMESLDLSINKLSGEIPQSISSLTFLSHLNLSGNNLYGSIPSSTQLESLDASCFAGNELCGPPLTKSCNTSDKKPTAGSEISDSSGHEEIEWYYVSIAIGYVVGFWGIVGPLLYSRQWRLAYFYLLYNIGSRLWFLVASGR